jgi:hypothetical protein
MSAASAGGRAVSGTRPPLRTHAREMAVGLVLGLVGLGFAAILSEEQGRIFLGGLLAGIAFVYLGFAVADGRKSAILVQVVSVLVFLNIANLGVEHDSALLLGLGFLGHAAWDALHHEHHGPTEVRTWYPPFCAVADLVIGLPVALGLII